MDYKGLGIPLLEPHKLLRRVELVRDAWDQSSSTTILWFVIVILVLSNVWWTLMRMGASRDEASQRMENT